MLYAGDQPDLVEQVQGLRDIRSIVIGEYHIAAINHNKQAITLGSNELGKCNILMNKVNSTYVPRKDLVAVAAGYCITLYVTEGAKSFLSDAAISMAGKISPNLTETIE